MYEGYEFEKYEGSRRMRCSINLQSDPISLNIIAADGKGHQLLDTIGNGGFVDVIVIGEQPTLADAPKA